MAHGERRGRVLARKVAALMLEMGGGMGNEGRKLRPCCHQGKVRACAVNPLLATSRARRLTSGPRRALRPRAAGAPAQISRILAAKCSLSVRVDALSDSDQVTIGIESRHKVEERIRQLEGRPLLGDARAAAARAKPTDVYYPPAVPAATYNPLGDSADVGKKPKKDKADKKGRKDANGAEGGEAKKKKRDADGDEDGEAKKKKKKDK